MKAHTNSGSSKNSRGPGVKPHMKIPAIMMAAVGEPGIPSTSIGRMAAVPAALFAASGATTPAG